MAVGEGRPGQILGRSRQELCERKTTGSGLTPGFWLKCLEGGIDTNELGVCGRSRLGDKGVLRFEHVEIDDMAHWTSWGRGHQAPRPSPGAGVRGLAQEQPAHLFWVWGQRGPGLGRRSCACRRLSSRTLSWSPVLMVTVMGQRAPPPAAPLSWETSPSSECLPCAGAHGALPCCTGRGPLMRNNEGSGVEPLWPSARRLSCSYGQGTLAGALASILALVP